MIHNNVSLCDRCENNFCELNAKIKKAAKDAGVEITSIWCGVTDRPEDERWDSCPNFKERS